MEKLTAEMTDFRPALPRSLGDKLHTYVKLATMLPDTYTPEELISLAWRIHPPVVPGELLKIKPDPNQVVADMVALRLLEPVGNGKYRRWDHLIDGNEPAMLRYAALTLLVPAGDGRYFLPVETAPFDGQPHTAEEWSVLGEPLMRWYEEAQLVVQTEDGRWQGVADVLNQRKGTGSTIAATNSFLQHLEDVRARRREQETFFAWNEALMPLQPELLKERIAEIQQHLLIDRMTILRVYRALIGGQHVILSGPPGTGKTHLARLLPEILWRAEEDRIILTMPADPKYAPQKPPHEQRVQQRGYAADVVTATEDWGVRHIVGGIAPRLEQTATGNSLSYSIRHGCLTQAVLANYATYDGETIPAPLYRQEVRDQQGKWYRGKWLIIDEFTRAPIDAAFGGLLTTLGGQGNPLVVPTNTGDVAVPLPKDFRIIGTLNSFDRHFLNQMSEAMKRRFVFIDVLPPNREQAAAEQAVAVYRALMRLHNQQLEQFVAISDNNAKTHALWEDVLSVEWTAGGADGTPGGYTLTIDSDSAAEAAAMCAGVQRIFTAIRVYRQLGTAQVEAVYTTLFTGRVVGMEWGVALDTALADTLADQLQVLGRDEVRVLLAFLEHAADAGTFRAAVVAILEQMPIPRQIAHLTHLEMVRQSLGELAMGNDGIPPIDTRDVKKLTEAQLAGVFGVGEPGLPIGSGGVFARRVAAFVSERGL
jgi:hypothetical protein